MIVLAELQKFTAKDLEEYDGKKGKPAYVAYKGKVYDFSQSGLWSGGEHMGMHNSGKDITEELEIAPHGEEVFQRKTVRLIGELV